MMLQVVKYTEKPFFFLNPDFGDMFDFFAIKIIIAIRLAILCYLLILN